MFRKIRTKLISVFLIVGLLPLTIISILNFNIADSSIEKESFNKLTAIREIKKNQVEEYFGQIKNQVITLSEDQMIIDAMNEFIMSFNSISDEFSFENTEFENVRTRVSNYYKNEFLSKLNKNLNVDRSTDDYLPIDKSTLILQDLYFASNPNATGEKDKLENAHDNSSYSSIHFKYHSIIRSYLKKFGYYDIFLIDNTGDIVYSVYKEVDFATNLSNGPYSNTNFARAFKSVLNASAKNIVKLEDFERYDPSYASPASFIASPIFDSGEQIGVLVFQMPVEKINNIMTGNNAWKENGLGESGETYLIGSDLRMRSNSRFLIENPQAYYKDLENSGVDEKTIHNINSSSTSILFQSVETQASKNAINGKSGIDIITDYRGINVLSAYAPLNIEGIKWGILSEIDEDEAFASSNNLLLSSSIIVSASSILVFLIGFFFARSISNPIVKLSSAAEKVANGNVDTQVDIKLDDEVGVLANSFNSMVQNIKSSIDQVREKSKIAEKAAKEAAEAEKLAHDQKIYLERNTSRLLEKMELFAKGDLTVNLEPERKDDDIGRLLSGFNMTVERIRNMIFRVKDAVEATASASAQISSSTEEMAAGGEEQSSQITEIASAIEQMASTILETSNNANKANNSASGAGKLASEGGEIVGNTVSGMNRIAEVVLETDSTVKKLGKSSDKIGVIVQVINEIADQTNLLALNAAIEAARAGEHGRGFAVVADEVKKLAERTTVATNEIAEMIKQIQNDTNGAILSIDKGIKEVDSGKHLANKAGESLDNIIATSNEVVDLINNVAIAAEEQSSASEEISKNIEQINIVVNESAVGIQQIARASDDLNQLTENLHNLIIEFKVEEGQEIVNKNYSVNFRGKIKAG